MSLIDLSKKARIVLEKKEIQYVKANIVLGIDRSGSMGTLYEDGVVQQVVDRLLAIGMNIDVNKSIEVFAFNTSGKYIGDANESNHEKFVNRHIANHVGGGTKYAPVMEMITEQAGFKLVSVPEKEEKSSFFSSLFKKKPVAATNPSPSSSPTTDVPTLVFFITDGENSDPHASESLIRAVSKYPIFWQFVGIGNESFSFLKELDEMEGRFIDNANFFQVNDIARISAEELYDRILNEFPMWLKEAKAKGILS